MSDSTRINEAIQGSQAAQTLNHGHSTNVYTKPAQAPERYQEELFQVETGSILDEGFGMVPFAVMRESTLSRDARLLYAYLMSGLTANPPSTVQTAQQDLALSRDEIDSLLAELESFGFIAIENRNVGGTEQPTVTMLYQVPRAKGGR